MFFLLVLLLHLLTCIVPIRAPLPPCTPFLFLNKLVEANNWSSDMNPYYPVRPCPYQNPRKAPLRMQFAIFNPPKVLLNHIGTELNWLVHKGIPRGMRMLLGRERFRVNSKILREGPHRHYTGSERRQQFGHNSVKTKQYY